MGMMDLFPKHFKGTALEVGACDGLFNSNTLAMEQSGWKVLCIEANPAYEELLRGCRKDVMMCAVGATNEDSATFHVHSKGTDALKHASWSSLMQHPNKSPTHTVEVPVRTLDSCLEEWGVDHLDYLSVDVEGTEMDVLEGFSFDKWKPQVVSVENWAKSDKFFKLFQSYNMELRERRAYDEVFVHAV